MVEPGRMTAMEVVIREIQEGKIKAGPPPAPAPESSN
jgi:hypothetical protein